MPVYDYMIKPKITDTRIVWSGTYTSGGVTYSLGTDQPMISTLDCVLVRTIEGQTKRTQMWDKPRVVGTLTVSDPGSEVEPLALKFEFSDYSYHFRWGADDANHVNGGNYLTLLNKIVADNGMTDQFTVEFGDHTTSLNVYPWGSAPSAAVVNVKPDPVTDSDSSDVPAVNLFGDSDSDSDSDSD